MAATNDWAPWQELLDQQRRRRPRRRATGWWIPVLCTVVVSLLLVGAHVAHGEQQTDTWRRMAQCESESRWDLDTGNGYYGGLQFSSGTWNAYRAPDMPARADWADVFQQVWVGEHVLDAEGWGAWPYCSRRLGLR